MEQKFISSLMPGAKLLQTDLEKGIYIYEFGSQLVALVDTELVGPISESLKRKIIQCVNKPIKCFSLFRHRSEFVDSEDIAWDTYVWFADAPTHYIHFDKNASVLQLQLR